MKLTIKNGWAKAVNPYTEKEARKAFEKKNLKFKVFQADGETPFQDTKEIDDTEFKKVYKAGVQRTVLVHQNEVKEKVITITVTPSDEAGKIDVNTRIPNGLTVKDALVSMQQSYFEYSELLQTYFEVNSHQELIEFLNENPGACDVLVREVLYTEVL